MSIDVEAAKMKYLSQWQHCAGKRVTAVDGQLLCDCGAGFPWSRTLGEDVELAIQFEWLMPVPFQIPEQGTAQPGLFE